MFYHLFWQVRRDSNPQPPVLETGALPIELLTYFQPPPRYLSLHAPCYDLRVLSRFLMSRMLSTEPTILIKLKPISRFPFILCRTVVSPLAIATC